MVTVGGIVNGGMRVLRERPAAVLVWSAINLAVTLAGSFLVLMPAMQAQFAAEKIGASPMAALSRIYLFNLVTMVLVSILFAAALRAVLKPASGGFAYLRLGLDELRLLGFYLLNAIVFIVLLFVFVLVGVIGAAAIFGPHDAVSVGVAMLASMLLFAVFLVAIQVRLSPATALTMMRQKIVIGEAWRLTRGHFWVMFGGYAVLFVALLIPYIGIMALTSGPYLADLLHGGFARSALAAARRHQSERLAGGPDIMMILGWIASAIVSGIGVALWGGAIATTTDDLLGKNDMDYAATFE